MKIPTASPAKRLGTGAVDFTLGLELFQSYGVFHPFASAGYRFVGQAEGFALDDAASASIGLGVTLTRWLTAGISYDWRQSASRSRGDYHEISPYASLPLPAGVRFGPYASIGLSPASPDFAVGLQIRKRFSIR